MHKVRANTRALDKLLDNRVKIFGVTKACMGAPRVAEAMLAGGAAGLADSRMEALMRLRRRFKQTPLLMLRQPMRHEVKKAVENVDFISVSEVTAIKRLARAAADKDAEVAVFLIIEVGEGRDGLTQAEFPAVLREVKQLKNVRPAGLLANVGCCGRQAPTREQLLKLIDLSQKARRYLGRGISILSGGNSAVLPLIMSNQLPVEINQLRLGEAILLGWETVGYRPLPGLATDAFTLEAEVIEVKEKHLPDDGGRRAVLALGRQDIGAAPVKPLLKGREVMRGSDHLVLRPTPGVEISSGDTVKFRPSYFALAAAMASPYVKKVYKGLSNRG